VKGLALAAALAAAASARAQSIPVELRVEPGAAFFVSSAQQARYGPAGAAVGARADVPVWQFLSAELGGGYLVFPFTSSPDTPAGGALALGGGLRATFRPVWLQAAAHLVVSGPNLRPGYELGAGGDLGKAGPFTIGPYVRFLHVIQPPTPLQDPTSPLVLSAGVSISLTLGAPEAAPVAAEAPGKSAPGGKAPTKPRVASASQIASGDDLVVLTHDKIQIKAPTRFETISFEPGTAQITRDSYLLLATVAKVMFLHPEIRRVQIQGHTDSVGAPAANRELSGRRAEAVRKHLIEVNGVEPDRLDAIGYGPDKPLAANDTAEGRAQNRRVEFFITERADEPGEGPLPALEPPAAPPAPAPGPAGKPSGSR
jgi:outer membrane protein OmpA-like peptidoglycan-associated protein